MNELNRAGKLYINDYFALKFAEEQLTQFLNRIFSDTAEYTNSAWENSHSKNVAWVMQFSNDTNKIGKGDLYPEFDWNGRHYGKKENQISVRYWDIRKYRDMENADCIRLSIRCLKELKDRMMELPEEVLKMAIKAAEHEGINLEFRTGEPLYKQFVVINLDDADETAHRIAVEMTRMKRALDAFLDTIIEDGKKDIIAHKRASFINLIESFPKCKVEVYNQENESFNILSTSGLSWKVRSPIWGKIHRGIDHLRIDLDYPSGTFSIAELKSAIGLPFKSEVDHPTDTSHMNPVVNGENHDVLRLIIHSKDFKNFDFKETKFLELIRKIIEKTIL
ncbi:hypothetical protein [Salisediminibacterium beveridgei]|uniref:Uncharacterized protein n=1 Tax=Salisediminibacterium beveridgei TaxID=632773 RepID=A0A1D7QWY3_9BACI|nr:hypothetical protein [Salisediminibacterium beveridgei]AOM83516.1 hypothetical protein BBEV_2158 [Salisediminibacterium beveridgei]